MYPKSAKVALTYDPAATSSDVLSGKLDELGFPPASRGHDAGAAEALAQSQSDHLPALSGILLGVGLLLGLAGVAESVTLASISPQPDRRLFLGPGSAGGTFPGASDRHPLLMSVAAIVATLMGQAAEGAMLVYSLLLNL